MVSQMSSAMLEPVILLLQLLAHIVDGITSDVKNVSIVSIPYMGGEYGNM